MLAALMRRRVVLLLLATLAIPATTALAASWTGTWTGTPLLNLGVNTPTCCSQVANNYTNTVLRISLHRTGAGYRITALGPLSGLAGGPTPGTAPSFIFQSSAVALASNKTGQNICSRGTVIAGGDWPWGSVSDNTIAYARVRFPGCSVFNKWTVVELDNGDSAIATVN